MYSTAGGAGGGEVDGERSGLRRRCLARLAGVDTPVGLRSGSTRSWSDVGVAARLRLGGVGEDVDSRSRGLVFGAASHGRVRGGIVVVPVGGVVRGCRVEWWCLVAHVLESFSLARFMRTLLVLMDSNRDLGGNISRDVACE